MKKAFPESQKVEYKASWQEEYFKWICGYANAKGGKLYIGVNDDGYVIGVGNTRYLLDVLPNQVNLSLGITVSIDHEVAHTQGENLKYSSVPADIAMKPENLYARGVLTKKAVADIEADPHDKKNVTPDVQALFDAAPGFVKQLRQNGEYRKKVGDDVTLWERENPVHVNPDGLLEYVLITVDAFPYGVSYHGHYYIRSGGTTTELKGMELSRFLMDKVGKKWDGMPVSKAYFDNASLDYLRKKAVAKGRLTEDQVKVADNTLLDNLNMITEDGQYTRAAAMLFGNPEKVIVGSYIMIGYFAPAGSHGMNGENEVIYHDDVRGPLILQAEHAIDYLYSKYLKALISYDGLTRVENYMIPRDAMREIVLNAIAHKNYSSGNPIQIKVFDDHITVMNEGLWPFDELPVEEAYVGEHSSYRSNPLIAAGLYTAGEIETWGQGFGKIKTACARVNAPLPEIKATKGSVTITINASEAYMRLLHHGVDNGSTTLSHSKSKSGMTIDELTRVLEFCNVPRSRVEIQEFCGYKSAAYLRRKVLHPLLEGGQLVPMIPEQPNHPKQKYVRRTATQG